MIEVRVVPIQWHSSSDCVAGSRETPRNVNYCVAWYSHSVQVRRKNRVAIRSSCSLPVVPRRRRVMEISATCCQRRTRSLPSFSLSPMRLPPASRSRVSSRFHSLHIAKRIACCSSAPRRSRFDSLGDAFFTNSPPVLLSTKFRPFLFLVNLDFFFGYVS